LLSCYCQEYLSAADLLTLRPFILNAGKLVFEVHREELTVNFC